MKNKLLLIFILTSLNTLGQEVKKYYHDTGPLKTEVAYDEAGLIKKYSTWDTFGNLLVTEDLETQYKNYPKRDFSKIKWKNIIDGVSIFKFNEIDTNIVVSDSSFVKLNYQCFLDNGKMIDNSFATNCPLEGRLDLMVKGFIEGVKRMKPGETTLIKIDPHMAYGDEIAGNVPANSTLIYLIELIAVE